MGALLDQLIATQGLNDKICLETLRKRLSLMFESNTKQIGNEHDKQKLKTHYEKMMVSFDDEHYINKPETLRTRVKEFHMLLPKVLECSEDSETFPNYHEILPLKMDDPLMKKLESLRKMLAKVKQTVPSKLQTPHTCIEYKHKELENITATYHKTGECTDKYTPFVFLSQVNIVFLPDEKKIKFSAKKNGMQENLIIEMDMGEWKYKRHSPTGSTEYYLTLFNGNDTHHSIMLVPTFTKHEPHIVYTKLSADFKKYLVMKESLKDDLVEYPRNKLKTLRFHYYEWDASFHGHVGANPLSDAQTYYIDMQKITISPVEKKVTFQIIKRTYNMYTGEDPRTLETIEMTTKECVFEKTAHNTIRLGNTEPTKDGGKKTIRIEISAPDNVESAKQFCEIERDLTKCLGLYNPCILRYSQDSPQKSTACSIKPLSLRFGSVTFKTFEFPVAKNKGNETIQELEMNSAEWTFEPIKGGWFKKNRIILKNNKSHLKEIKIDLKNDMYNLVCQEL